MTQHHAEAHPDDPNDLHTAVARLVGTDRRVLLVAAGDAVELLDVLRERGCRVGQVELGRDARLREVEGAGADVDVVVLVGVLDRVGDPAALVADATARLRPGGSLVVTVPNVTHGSVRLALLQGRWRPSDPALLHHWSRSSLLGLVRGCGLATSALHARVGDVVSGTAGLDGPRVPPTVVEWVRDQPDALTTHWVLEAVLDPAAEDAIDPEPVPLVPEHSRRATDRFSDEVLDHEDLRHRLLTLRDHVLGLEAAASAARSRAEVAEARESAVRRRLDRKNDVLAQLRRRARRAERRLQEAGAGDAAPTGLRRVGRRVGGSGSPS